MTPDRANDYLAGLMRELCKLPRETEWVEFKVNNSEAARRSRRSRQRRATSHWRPGCCAC
jgi:hypothetical protein